MRGASCTDAPLSFPEGIHMKSMGSLADFENEVVPELDARFVCVYGAELTDARLTWAEKGILWYLRYRCCNTFRGGSKNDTGETIMSWGRLSEEVGEPLRTLRRRVASLRRLGFIRCSSRGLGRSHVKIIVRPSANYNPDTFVHFDRLIAGKRSEEKVRLIRSLDLEVNEAQKGEVDDEEDGVSDCNEDGRRPAEARRSNDVSSCNDDGRRPAKNGRTMAAKSGRTPPAKSGRICIDLEYGEVEWDSESPRCARGEPGFAEVRPAQAHAEPGLVVEDQDTSPSGQGPRATTKSPRPSASAPRGEETTPRSDPGSSRGTRGTSAFGLGASRETEGISLARDTLVPMREQAELGREEDVDTSADDGPRTPAEIEADRRREQARALTRSAGRRAADVGEARAARRRKRKAAQEASGEAAEHAKEKAAAKKKRQTAGSKLHDHCQASFERYFPEVPWGKWLTQERSQAKQLLEVYGGDLDLVAKAWDFCCENWDHLKKKLKLDTSYPTIGFLFGYRSRIMAMVQDVKSNAREIMDRSGKGKFEL